jgi:hypothetical protein
MLTAAGLDHAAVAGTHKFLLMLGSSQGFKPDLQFIQKKKKKEKKRKHRERERKEKHLPEEW